uniref:ATP synthase complex subunit 8 n=1 Tax=Mordellidae sp. GENSP01 TaxID=1205565 RepID=A0A0S2MS12_9CUCU|nr:ATP synthase F0 subunit 8 [Mordellidae sp. GENSP01]
MPQMSPLNWLTLMMSFITLLIMFNTLNYYTFSYTKSKTDTKKKKISINWKW